MKTDWRTHTLGECATLLSGGTPSKKKPEYWGGEIPWISCKDMKVGRIHDSQDHLTELGAENGTRLVPPGTILIVVRGMILAKDFPIAITCKQVGFNQDLKAVQPAPHTHAPFLYYWLLAKSYEIKGIADEAAHGTKRLQSDRLLSLQLRLPPLRLQRKIAAILSAYDDLIENNLRRIAVLEEMAQALYREWFVCFRFPGHEGVRMVDSPLGKIPAGWRTEKLVNSCLLVMGQSPKSEFYNPTGEGLPFHQGVSDFGARFPTDRIYCTVTNRTANKGDILFSVRAPVGRINIAHRKLVVGRGLSAIRHKDDFQWFLFHQLKERFRDEDSMGGGTIFKAVTKRDMEGLDLLNPETSVVQTFETLVTPMNQLLKILTSRNENLRQTRDLLLPRLISGELDVSELEIDVGEMAK